MQKLDHKKEFKALYQPPRGKFVLVDVPPLQFLMIDGEGNPNASEDYAKVVGTLYAISYKAKFLSKKEAGIDYVVMPLEGLWYADDLDVYSERDLDRWQWTMMIMQPGHITPAMIEESIREAGKKKELAPRERIRMGTYHEGLSAQTLYVGAYANEGPTIQRMHEFIQEQGHQLRGHHHEIYLSDPRRVAPEKLKTILRQPVA